MFEYDATDVKMIDVYEPVPNGRYKLRIKEVEETESAKGNKQVICTLQIFDDDEFAGRLIKYHRVTFFPKDHPAAWIALRWLKAIGEPHKDNFTVNPTNWIGKVLEADIAIREYVNKENQKRTGNEIRTPYAYDGFDDDLEKTITVSKTKESQKQDGEEIPF